MLRHLARLSAATSIIVACMFLPFLPGGYDALAVTLSIMSQLFGIAGLLLVPLGAIWLTYELAVRAPNARTWRGKDLGFWFALASIGAATLVALIVSLGAVIGAGPSLALGTIALWAYCAARFAGKLKAMATAEVRTFNPAPLYLVVLPIVAAAFKFTLVAPAVEFSRSRAIRNSARLIADVEHYRAANGRYPASLLSVWEDYHPGVIGIEAYRYEPSGDAYNLFFEQFSDRFGTREFVMYNPRNQQAMTSHKMDRLQLSPQELVIEQTRGHNAVHDASHPHWKYFWFD
jgi:hypothetical protein